MDLGMTQEKDMSNETIANLHAVCYNMNSFIYVGNSQRRSIQNILESIIPLSC